MRFESLQTDFATGGCITLTKEGTRWIVTSKGPRKPHLFLNDSTREVIEKEKFSTRKEALACYAEQGGEVWAALDLEGQYGKVMRLFAEQDSAVAYVDRTMRVFARTVYGKNALTHLMWAARPVRACAQKGERVWLGNAT